MNERDIAQSGTWLAIDCSTSSMTISVLSNGELLGEKNTRAERNHSILLIPTVQELMQSLQMEMRDLDGIAVGSGPGSYTGVRIGVTVAKTFAWSLRRPLVGVSSLAALAHGGSRLDGYAANQWIVPLMDARRGQVYTGLYGREAVQASLQGSGAETSSGRETESGTTGDRWSCLVADGIRPMDDWIREVGALLTATGENAGISQRTNRDLLFPPDRLVFVGEVESFIVTIDAIKHYWSGEATTSALDMRAFDVGLLAVSRWARGEQEDVHSFVPNYTQLPEAEKKLLTNNKGRS